MKTITANNLVAELSAIISEKRVSLIDSVCIWCHDNNVEIEDVVPILKSDKNLVAKIQDEATNLSLLKKTKKKETIFDG